MPQKGGAAVLLQDRIAHYVTKCNTYGQEYFLSETQVSHWIKIHGEIPYVGQGYVSK